MTERMLLGTSEEWKRIASAPDYEVSSFGQVRGYRESVNVRGRFTSTILDTPRLLSFEEDDAGYLRVRLRRSGKKRVAHLVHRLVAQAFIPNPENKPEVNHKDCNKSHNAVLDLEWSTEKENIEHAIAMGRVIPLGPRFRKLSPEQVREIRSRPRYYGDQGHLAREFGVRQCNISNILRGVTYKEC